MRLTVSDPAALPELVSALRRGHCLADADSGTAVVVGFPWVETLAEARQAIVELAFFAKTWEATHPGVSIRLEPAA